MFEGADTLQVLKGQRQARDSGADAPPETTAATIFGCAGTAATDDERAFFRDAAPWGFILFARNIESPEQVRRLTGELRDSVGWRAPVLIDQEGGRVARLRPPHWRGWPPVGDWCAAADAGRLEEERLWELLALRFRLIASELIELGVDVDCMPALDLRLDGASDIIGDRALGSVPETVAARGAVICEALLAGGVLPVVKHLPGHGRADVDSHLSLPVVRASRAELERDDFAAFAGLRDQPLGMTAHIVYEDLDPDLPATMSPVVIEQAIRGAIGFDGLLMTDDLSMGALGELAQGAGFAWRAEASLAAGCDLALHCNGDRAEMEAVRDGAGPLSAEARRRSAAALAMRAAPEPFLQTGRLDQALAEAGLA